ncbi:MAG: 1-acyl-sn-glycerol-3-phosphate acyltransferase [Tenericutes bacterium]|nr:1-acyl-sn-glycerol-3-phosphate acyltransferase [Mycoplasmatota bacterium]
MKKRRIDRQQDFLLSILRPFVYLWMRMDTKRKLYLGEGITFKRKEPFVMLANHTFMFDVIHVPLRFKNVPFIVASHTLFKKKATKFLVTQVAHVIAKSKGQSDTSTVRDLIGAVKRGYPILIFPEGDTTFYGETGLIEPSTMKLIKKLELDVVVCKVKGGYLSKPRWATGKRKHRSAEFHYDIMISKEKVKSLSLEEINDIITKTLYHNDYDYQRQVMIPHPGKKLAEGLEDVVYVCPLCQGIHTLETNGNHIRCNQCKNEGYIDEYGFIQNFKFDNLIDWNQYQKTFTKELRESVLETNGELYYLHSEDNSLDELGRINLKYENKTFYISGDHEEIIPLSDIQNATITLRRDFGFIYHEKNYLIKLDQYGAAFLRIAQDKY